MLTAKRRVSRASGVERRGRPRLERPALRIRMVGSPWVARRVVQTEAMADGEERSRGR